MPTRRRFLLTASAATTVVRRAHADATEKSALPPAIAALRDRRSEALPIPLTEQESRLERARALMHANRIDAIALAGGTSLDYFTGIRWGNSERLFTCVFPQKGNPFYVCPAFEEDRVRESMAEAPDGRESKMLTWQEDDDPYALVARALRNAGLGAGRLGIEERVPFVFSEGIRKAAGAVELASATPVTAGCRMIKSPAELKLMQLANDVTLAVYEAAWKSIHPGMTNSQVSDLIAAAYARTGFPGDASCQVDAWSALPHGSRQPQIIREGSIVLLDDGCEVEGYQSDISRTFVIGKPTDKMKRVFDVVHKAQSAALRAAKPGSRVPGRRLRRAQSGGRRGIRSPLHTLHAPRRSWYWNGRTRMAVPGEGQHATARGEHDDVRRAGDLFAWRIRRQAGRRHVYHFGRREMVHAAEQGFGNSRVRIERRLDARVPGISNFRRRRTETFSDVLQRVGDGDLGQVFDALVAELARHFQAKGRAVIHRQILTVQVTMRQPGFGGAKRPACPGCPMLVEREKHNVHALGRIPTRCIRSESGTPVHSATKTSLFTGVFGNPAARGQLFQLRERDEGRGAPPTRQRRIASRRSARRDDPGSGSVFGCVPLTCATFEISSRLNSRAREWPDVIMCWLA